MKHLTNFRKTEETGIDHDYLKRSNGVTKSPPSKFLLILQLKFNKATSKEREFSCAAAAEFSL